MLSFPVNRSCFPVRRIEGRKLGGRQVDVRRGDDRWGDARWGKQLTARPRTCLLEWLVVFAVAGIPRMTVADELEGLLDQLVGNGVVLTEDVRATLPPPTFLNQQQELLASEAANEKLEAIAAPLGGTDRFLRDSIVAPISIRMRSIDNPAGKRIGHRLDFVFAVSEPIATLRDSEPVRELVGDVETEIESSVEKKDFDPTEDARTRPLTEQQIARYGLSLDPKKDSVRTLQFPLMDRVIIQGVIRTERSVWREADANGPAVFAWLLDPRFSLTAKEPLVADSDGEILANRWRGIDRGDRGQKVISAPFPYRGIGGYLAITPAPGRPESSIFQASLVLHEPQDWFAGRNQLRSKLPLIVQDQVRRLRREIRNVRSF